MREDIREPQHWRSRSTPEVSWTARRRRSEHPTEIVDAAFEQELSGVEPVRASRRDAGNHSSHENAPAPHDIVQSLSTQLALLEEQREQLQKLLDQAQG
ncbi:MAG: hypothetical protein MI725_14980 [Pirellulales bacterium]|nr:hypothetical protein [Pirellulales bacterium]